jgi:hypothetical protein
LRRLKFFILLKRLPGKVKQNIYAGEDKNLPSEPSSSRPSLRVKKLYPGLKAGIPGTGAGEKNDFWESRLLEKEQKNPVQKAGPTAHSCLKY